MLPETNVTEKMTMPHLIVFWKFVKATPTIRLSNDYLVEQQRKNKIDATKWNNACVRQIA